MLVLKTYPGTVIFVTHDRTFIDALATHILSFENEKPRVVSLSNKEKKASTQTNEAELLAIEMKIIELLGRLSVAADEEKLELDKKFQELLKEKQNLL